MRSQASRRLGLIAVLAVLGVAAAVGIGLAANEISGDSIGLSAEPLRAGDQLAPRAASQEDQAEEPRQQRSRTRTRSSDDRRSSGASTSAGSGGSGSGSEGSGSSGSSGRSGASDDSAQSTSTTTTPTVTDDSG